MTTAEINVMSPEDCLATYKDLKSKKISIAPDIFKALANKISLLYEEKQLKELETIDTDKIVFWMNEIKDKGEFMSDKVYQLANQKSTKSKADLIKEALNRTKK